MESTSVVSLTSPQRNSDSEMSDFETVRSAGLDEDDALRRCAAGIDAIARGKMVVVMDDLERENEGDLIMAAEFATQQDVAFMVRHSGGILCIPCEADRLHELKLYSMVQNNKDPNNTAFTISVDYRVGTTTGISASDRAKTFRAFTDKNAKADQFTSPGHVFPLIYTPGGVLVRQGHTEASVDLCKLAGTFPAAVITEMVNDDGEPKRLQDCKEFCAEHNIPLLCVADIERYIQFFSENPDRNASAYRTSNAIKLEAACTRALRGHQTKLMSSCRISLSRDTHTLKDASMQVWKSLRTANEHIVLQMGDVKGKENVVVRIHSECATGDLLGSTRCDCGPQLTHAYKRLAEEGMGLIIYVAGHEGRGIGLVEKMKAYKVQDDSNLDTYQANKVLGHGLDLRTYEQSVEILKALGVKSVRLMTNNLKKVKFLERFIPTTNETHQTNPGVDSHSYMLEKMLKGNHQMTFKGARTSVKNAATVYPDARPFRTSLVSNKKGQDLPPVFSL